MLDWLLPCVLLMLGLIPTLPILVRPLGRARRPWVRRLGFALSVATLMLALEETLLVPTAIAWCSNARSGVGIAVAVGAFLLAQVPGFALCVRIARDPG